MNIWDQKIKEAHDHLFTLMADHEETHGVELDFEYIEEGCHCHNPNVMAPCGWCEGGCPSEEIFEAWVAWRDSQSAESTHNQKIRVALANEKYHAEQELVEAATLGRKFT